MAVTAASLAAALGIAVTDPNSDTDAGIVEAGRLLAIAGELVDAYLRGSTTCPAAIRDEAVIRTAGHLQPKRGYGLIEGRLKVGGINVPFTPASVSAVRQSGAGALLAPWVRRTA